MAPNGKVIVGNPTPLTTLSIPDETRSLHLRVMGEPGTGKTILVAQIALQDALRGLPILIVDGNGGLIDAVIRLLRQHPDGNRVLRRLVYFPLTRNDFCHGFPFFVPNENLSDYHHAQKFIETVMTITPGLVDIAVNLRHVGTTACAALHRARYQVTEAERFLSDNIFRAHVLSSVEKDLPEVAFFYRNEYDRLSRRDQAELSRSFRNKVSPFILSPELRAIVGQDKPTIPLERIEREKLIVALDLSQTSDYAAQVMGSVFIEHLSQGIFGRPISKAQPVSLVVDEAASLLAYAGLAKDFREFLSRARAFKLWLTISHQTLHQLDPSLRPALFSIANQIVFRQHEIESALDVARNLIAGDPQLAKFQMGTGNPTPLPLTEQLHINANNIQTLPNRRAIVRLFEPQGMLPRKPWTARIMTTPTVKFDGVTDEDVARIKRTSLARYGRPVAEALKEIEARQRRHNRPKDDGPTRDTA